MTNFVRNFSLLPAYDGRGHPRNYGIGSCRMHFSVTGPLGAIVASFGTSWYTPGEPQENNLSLYTKGYPFNACEELMQPKGWSIDYHAHAAQYDNQEISQDHCTFLGGPCYCDGSALYAREWVPVLLHEGSEGIFARLEQEYAFRFENGSPPDLIPVPFQVKD